MKLARLPTSVVLVMMAIATFEVMNFTNFCYRDLRYYGSDKLIRIAIQENINQYDQNGERNKMYSDARDVIAKNDGCCRLYYNNSALYLSIWWRLIGINDLAV